MLNTVKGSRYLSDGGLRVEHKVAERPLENPSELCEEASGVGDGSGRRSGGHLLSLNYRFCEKKIGFLQVTFQLFNCPAVKCVEVLKSNIPIMYYFVCLVCLGTFWICIFQVCSDMFLYTFLNVS